jgi:hypothetical protein
MTLASLGGIPAMAVPSHGLTMAMSVLPEQKVVLVNFNSTEAQPASPPISLAIRQPLI